MLFGYAIFYVCRLAFSATKKSMIEQGVYSAREIGYVGSAMLIAYAIGKIVNGVLADRANIRNRYWCQSPVMQSPDEEVTSLRGMSWRTPALNGVRDTLLVIYCAFLATGSLFGVESLTRTGV